LPSTTYFRQKRKSLVADPAPNEKKTLATLLVSIYQGLLSEKLKEEASNNTA
jgi:hypothetical protein